MTPDIPTIAAGLSEAQRRAANRQHLIGLLRREAAHSGVWFADSLSLAADEIEALAAQPAPPVEGERDHIRRSIIRQLGDNPDADRVILRGTDWDIVLEALRAAPLTTDPIACPDGELARELCDWPSGDFTFLDDPGEHDPCYVVMPGGASLPLNHHAGEGVDIARAKFIIAACNAALSPSSPVEGGER